MKSPLQYQMSESDFGRVSLLNCISYLFDREEMPNELVRVISMYAIANSDEDGNFVANDAYGDIGYFVYRWVNQYAEEKRIPLKSKFFKGEDVDVYQIIMCLKQGGCAFMKTIKGDGNHYVCITAIDNEYIYIFDPYFKSSISPKYVNDVEIVDSPFQFNRRVKLEHFLSKKRLELALGLVEERQVVLFVRNDTHLQRELG